jgi:hypothetical protein
VHAHHDPVDVVRLTRTGQFILQPGPLGSRAVPVDVRVVAIRDIRRDVVAPEPAEPAVLQADVVVVEEITRIEPTVNAYQLPRNSAEPLSGSSNLVWYDR